MHDTPIIFLRILLFLLFVSFMQKKCSVQQSPTFVGHMNPDALSIYSEPKMQRHHRFIASQ